MPSIRAGAFAFFDTTTEEFMTMLHRSIRRMRLSAPRAHLTFTTLAYVLLAGCASVGSQPPTYVEDAPKAKAQPCSTQSQNTQGKTATDACKKSGSQ